MRSPAVDVATIIRSPSHAQLGDDSHGLKADATDAIRRRRRPTSCSNALAIGTGLESAIRGATRGARVVSAGPAAYRTDAPHHFHW